MYRLSAEPSSSGARQGGAGAVQTEPFGTGKENKTKF